MSLKSVPSSPRVFISYSHDSDQHALRVLKLADALRDGGIDAWIDQYDPWPKEGWPQWMLGQIQKADFVLLVCTETYRRRFENDEAPDVGFGVTWEGAIITNAIYLAQVRQSKFLPVVWTATDKAFIPAILAGASHVVDLLASSGFEELYRRLTAQPKTPPPPLGSLRALTAPARLSFPGTAAAGTAAVAVPPSLAAYRNWAIKKYEHFELVGLDADEIKLSFDEVYVPLRLDEGDTRHFPAESKTKNPAPKPGVGAQRAAPATFPRGKKQAEPENTGGEDPNADLSFLSYQTNLELDRILLRQGCQVVILGEPGMGKTTALLKLHQLCFVLGPAALGLPVGTVPILLRLRHIKGDLIQGSLEELIAKELDELSKGHLEATATARELWRHGRLLLLLDGLDEIADAGQRRQVWDHLVWCLGDKKAAGCRAVVTCRIEGWPRDLEPGEGWLRFGVRPFDDDQIARLVELFFRYAPLAFPRVTSGLAEQRAKTLLAALAEREGEEGHRLIIMAATPLLLTLLCIVVLRGNEIPRRRALFYERCLEILLQRWRKQSADKEAPIPPQLAKMLVAELAFFLHERSRRDFRAIEALLLFGPRLSNHPEGKDVEVFTWLLEDAGLLTRLTEEQYGFLHLNLQEYLAACWLAENESLLDQSCRHYADSWWQQVFRLLAGMPGRRTFAALIKSLLATQAPFEKADLLRLCLHEAEDPEIQPFLAELAIPAPRRQAAILGLLKGRSDPALLEAAQKLESSSDPEVRALALEFRPRAEGSASPPDALCLLGAEAWPAARRLAALDFELWQPASGRLLSDPAQLQEMRAKCRVIALVWPGESCLLEEAANYWALCRNAERWLLLLPDSTLPPQSWVADQGVRQVRLQRFDDPSPVRAAFAEARAASLAASAAAVAKSVVATDTFSSSTYKSGTFVEPLTGEIFLWVPGGRFMMGSDRHRASEKPVHPVVLDEYWLARTPVTNRQYRLFLEANPKAREPDYWRQEKFAQPKQPVVGVSWHDAVAYCSWLSQKSGRPMVLPTEAQWEFAARGGAEQREYPWGEQRPSSDLAVFGNPGGAPLAVGSRPAGAGPFGHLDLAGNVWEWCRDVWTKDYRWCGDEATNPCFGKDADGSSRALRGGGFWLDAESLRSAVRLGYRTGFRGGDFGFRVAVSPASLDP